MFHLNKQKILIAFIFCLLLSATEVFGCRCVIPPNEDINEAVKNEVQNSTMVFAGKVVSFEYRKGIPNEIIERDEKISGEHIDYETKIVKFQVENWWKGEATTEVFLVTEEAKISDGRGTNSSCDYHFKEGESYLVYANEIDGRLRTLPCARTRPLTDNKDLKILGEGKEPLEKRTSRIKNWTRGENNLR